MVHAIMKRKCFEMKIRMRPIINLLLAVLTVTAFTACHGDEDELFCQAEVTLKAPAGMQIERMQATAMFTNLNTRQVVTTAEFDGTTAHVQLLRGAYQVLVEGTVRYTGTDGTPATAQFRAYTDYAALAQPGLNTLVLDLIKM